MEQVNLIDSNSLPKPARVSRDEMNLAEFPLTILSTRADNTTKTLEFKDTIKGKNGETLERRWILTGADKFGLPTSSDDEILLGLLKLTVDDGFRDRKVYFTRYELLRILRWTTEGRSYQRLQKALDRLTGVKIKATNAFYDNTSKSHSTRHFGIIDAYEINDGRNTDPKPSFFSWSDVLFNSFKAGYIKKLDLDFYLDLQSAISKRLYRFLDKHFWYKSKIEINLFLLAHEKIGVSRNYRYASSLKQQLDPALDELKAVSFVSHYEYEGRGEDTIIRIFAASAGPRVLELGNRKQAPQKTPELAPPGIITVDAATAPIPDEEDMVEVLEKKASQMLISRGIKSSQLDKLLKRRTAKELERILAIISYFDSLIDVNSHLVSRSPVGFLYRAIENFSQFALPGESRASVQTTLGLGRGKTPSTNISAARAIVGTKEEQACDPLEEEYASERRKEIERLRDEVEPEIYKRLNQEVEATLAKLGKSLSLARFKEVINYGVEEKLLKLFAFPDFATWKKDRSSRSRGRNI